MTSAIKPSSSLTSSIQLSPIPTPHWGAQPWPAFTVRATNRIHASSDAILSALLDTATWPEWNNFVSRASISPSTPTKNGRIQTGSAFTEHVDMSGKGKPSRTQDMIMISEEELKTTGYGTKGKGYKVVWVGKQFPDWALRTERVHEIQEEEGEAGNVRCVYDDYETMSGPLAIFVRLFVGRRLVQRFGQWNRELGGYVEGKKAVASLKI